MKSLHGRNQCFTCTSLQCHYSSSSGMTYLLNSMHRACWPQEHTSHYLSQPPLSITTPFKDTSITMSIPTAYFPLLLNTLTQLLCASGVHRLTGKVSSLTVTLTLVVRKAVSLVISVLLYGDNGAHNVKMWAGAVLVLAGTVGYSMGGQSPKVTSSGRKSKVKEE